MQSRLKDDLLDILKIVQGIAFYLPTKQVIIVSRDIIFLEKEFLKEGGKRRKIMLDEESSKEAQQIDQMDIDQH